jgi:hypothetical protein
LLAYAIIYGSLTRTELTERITALAYGQRCKGEIERATATTLGTANIEHAISRTVLQQHIKRRLLRADCQHPASMTLSWCTTFAHV